MALDVEKTDHPPGAPTAGKAESTDSESEKKIQFGNESLDQVIENELNVTDRDLQEAKAAADAMSLEKVKGLMKDVVKIHQHDPNFPTDVLDKIINFLDNKDVLENPDEHQELIYEMKIEAALITNNSPYAEVRCVVDNHDDPTIPSSTIRAWVIGLCFSVIMAFVNQLFSPRMPGISIGATVAQLLAYPLGKFCERVLPDWGVTLFGTRHSLNPGHFSRKEHMLITIMASVSMRLPYTTSIVMTQYLPQFFNQPYAASFGYQIMIALSTNLIGNGLAGLTRRFLVYPSYCVWPTSLVTIALNSAFHSEENLAVKGPFRHVYRVSRYRFFMLAFTAMFVWFWFPNKLFTALGSFNWMTWIAPNNVKLAIITGFKNGLGLNPWSTFDWNNLLVAGADPLLLPFFSTFNRFIGTMISFFAIVGLYFNNAYFTGYLPLRSNRVFDNTGAVYNISRAIDSRGVFDATKYESYSPVYISAANVVVYTSFFAIYPATMLYIFLNHRHEVKIGLVKFWNSLRGKEDSGTGEYQDVHNRLMSVYREVPEWWYFLMLAFSIAGGIFGITGWETYVSPGVVFFGIALTLAFVVPTGIIAAMTGYEVTLNVLAEFIGGAFAEGNALAMNFFKAYGFVTCAHAIAFANDLKLAHSVKIPPRHTFMAQVIPTIVSTFVSTAVLGYQIRDTPDICTPHARNKMSCPGTHGFFTSAVLWGTLGPKKMFGNGGFYTMLMIGWPLGIIFTLITWFIQRKFRGHGWVRQIHPIAMLWGAINFSPYNLSYYIPSVWIAWLSWIWCKRRFLGFWSKYNFVLSAAFGAGVSVAAVVLYFALDMHGVEFDWWGNSVGRDSVDSVGFTLFEITGGHFGPGPGEFH